MDKSDIPGRKKAAFMLLKEAIESRGIVLSWDDPDDLNKEAKKERQDFYASLELLPLAKDEDPGIHLSVLNQPGESDTVQLEINLTYDAPNDRWIYSDSAGTPGYDGPRPKIRISPKKAQHVDDELAKKLIAKILDFFCDF